RRAGWPLVRPQEAVGLLVVAGGLFLRSVGRTVSGTPRAHKRKVCTQTTWLHPFASSLFQSRACVTDRRAPLLHPNGKSGTPGRSGPRPAVRPLRWPISRSG